MNEERFIVIDVKDVDKAVHTWVTDNHMASKWILDTETGEQYWDLGYDDGGAEQNAARLNAVKYPDFVLALRDEPASIETIDNLVSGITAPLLERIKELEASLLDKIANE